MCMQDKNNWEGFYFRPHSSGKKGAVQHYAIVNGKEKQQDSYKVNFPTNGAWYKVTIKVTKDKWSCTAGGATFTGNRNIKGIPVRDTDMDAYILYKARKTFDIGMQPLLADPDHPHL